MNSRSSGLIIPKFTLSQWISSSVAILVVIVPQYQWSFTGSGITVYGREQFFFYFPMYWHVLQEMFAFPRQTIQPNLGLENILISSACCYSINVSDCSIRDQITVVILTFGAFICRGRKRAKTGQVCRLHGRSKSISPILAEIQVWTCKCRGWRGTWKGILVKTNACEIGFWIKIWMLHENNLIWNCNQWSR